VAEYAHVRKWPQWSEKASQVSAIGAWGGSRVCIKRSLLLETTWHSNLLEAESLINYKSPLCSRL